MARDIEIKIRADFEAEADINKAAKSLGKISDEAKKTSKDLKSLQKQLNDVQTFKKLATEVRATQTAFRAAQANVKRLAAEYAAAERPTKAMARNLELARTTVTRLSGQLDKQRATLKESSAALKASGINTAKLAQSEKLLGDAVASTTAKLRAQNTQLAATNKATKTLGQTLSKIDFTRIGAGLGVGGVAAGLGGRAILSPIRQITESIIEQERVERQLEARIRSTGAAAGFTAQQLQQLATDLQGLTTFGDEATIGLQSVLLTFTQIQGLQFERATESALNVATALGVDLKSAAIQVGKALNDPEAGISSLTRSGVQFTQEQKDLIQSFVDLGDVVSAQGVILDELDVQFGGAARAARDTFGGALQAVSNAFGDLLETRTGFPEAQKALENLAQTLSSPELLNAADTLISLLSELIAELALAAQAVAEWVAANPELAKDLGEFALTLGVVLTALSPLLIGLGAAVFATGALASSFGTLSAASLTAAASLGKLGKVLRVGLWTGVISETLELISVMQEAQDVADETAQRHQDMLDEIGRSIAEGEQFRDVEIISEDQFNQLSQREQKAYKDSLERARQYYVDLAKLADVGANTLKANDPITALLTGEDFTGTISQEVDRELIETAAAYGRAADSLGEIRETTAQQQAQFNSTIARLRKEQTESLEAQIDEELALLKDANRQVEQAQEERLKIEEEFRDFRQSIFAEEEGPVDFIDAARLRQQAQLALSQGDTEAALDFARKAKDAIEELNEAGENKAALLGLATSVEQIANDAAKAAEDAARAEVASIEAEIQRLAIEAAALQNIEISFDLTASSEQLLTQLQTLAQQLAQGIVIPIDVVPGDKGADVISQVVPGFATGGLIHGPGTGTSDSVLMRGSRGEYVVQEKAVQALGVSALNIINQGQIPRFAEGGLVGGGDTVNLSLPGGDVVALKGEAGTAKIVGRSIIRESLKRGRKA